MDLSAATLALVLRAAVVSVPSASGALATLVTVGAHSITDPLDRQQITVPKSAVHVGGERFTLYGNADCELHLWVDAEAEKRVKRLYWVQFERILPRLPKQTYHHGDNKRTANRKTREGSDREHVNALLAKAGYIPPRVMLQVRFVRLPDDPAGTGRGRRELMLIYAEDLALSGETYEGLGFDGDETPRWGAIEPALVQRGAATFNVTAR